MLLPFEGPKDYIPIEISELEAYFYSLDLSNKQERLEAILKIAKKIPWTYRIPDVIDKLSDPALRAISRQYSSEIHFQRTLYCLKKLALSERKFDYKSLEEGAFLISTATDSSENYEDFQRSLDRISAKVEELYDINRVILTDSIKLHLLSRVLYQEEGFTGNKVDYNNPENSLITLVMQRKLGIPISLSIIQLLIASRLKLPIYGANFPLHFMLYYESKDFKSYIDPFHGGVLVNRDICKKFLEANGFPTAPEDYHKPSTVSILKRMLNNLIHNHRKMGKIELEKIYSSQLLALQ